MRFFFCSNAVESSRGFYLKCCLILNQNRGECIKSVNFKESRFRHRPQSPAPSCHGSARSTANSANRLRVQLPDLGFRSLSNLQTSSHALKRPRLRTPVTPLGKARRGNLSRGGREARHGTLDEGHKHDEQVVGIHAENQRPSRQAFDLGCLV